jgi:cytidyltransferase-like protein
MRVSSSTRSVYVDMVGDLFHAGHVRLLRDARALGDRLIVGLLSDETVAAYKRRPIMTLSERAAVVGACRFRFLPYTPGVSTTDIIERIRTRDAGPRSVG